MSASLGGPLNRGFAVFLNPQLFLSGFKNLHVHAYPYSNRIYPSTGIQDYPASRGFSLVFLSVVLPFSSRFWLLTFCFGCFCAEEKTSADSPLGFLLSMRIKYLQDLGGNHMTKLVVEPVLSARASLMY